MLIILEGVDGSGKTAVSRALSDLLPLSTLVKLSGAPRHVTDEGWMKETYESLIPFLVHQGSKGHVIIDRFMPSELVYSPIFKGYTPSYFDDFLGKIHKQVETHFFYLDASDEVLEERLVAKAKEQPNEQHISLDALNRVREGYNNWLIKCGTNYPLHYCRIKVDNNSTPNSLAESIITALNIRPEEQDDTYSRPIEGES